MKLTSTQWLASSALLVATAALASSLWAHSSRSEADSGAAPAAESEGHQPAERRVASPAEPMRQRGEPAKAGVVPPTPAGSSALAGEAVAQASRAPSPAVVSEVAVIRRVAITSGVEGREPVEGAQPTAGGAPIYAFIEAANPATEAATLVVSFERGERRVGNVELEIPPGQSRWRTWGYTRHISEPGVWRAVVRDGADNTLVSQEFEVAPAPASALSAAGASQRSPATPATGNASSEP